MNLLLRDDWFRGLYESNRYKNKILKNKKIRRFISKMDVEYTLTYEVSYKRFQDKLISLLEK